MGHHDHDDDDNPSVFSRFAKNSLMVLGGVFALWLAAGMLFGTLFFFVGLMKNVLFFGALAGAGYLGYRMVAGSGERKSLRGGRSPRALGPGRGGRSRGGGGDDFERKMRELDAIERRLDAEIGKR